MKSIFITWTSTWIWKALSEALSSQYKIFWISRRKTELSFWSFFEWDLRDEKYLDKIVSEIETIDYLIINAWVWYFWNFSEIDEEKNKEILEINLLSPLLFIHKFLKQDTIKKWVIFMGSYAGKKSMKYGSAYMASKFWLRWLAMGLHNETKLAVHIINPKIVVTEFHTKSDFDVSSLPHTDMKEILNVVENIIAWNEKRFEIDL